MKILHTADWHLDQTFYEYDRREEHLHFLEWLKQQIRQHEIDVLLIAGDVFDSPNPSAESQRMYYRFLREVIRFHYDRYSGTKCRYIFHADHSQHEDSIVRGIDTVCDRFGTTCAIRPCSGG